MGENAARMRKFVLPILIVAAFACGKREWTVPGNPAAAHKLSRRSGSRPSVPRPAPPGSDIADDMHVDTDVAYIIASSGFLRLVDHSGADRISFISQVPSGFNALLTDAAASAGRGMSWRQSRVSIRS